VLTSIGRERTAALLTLAAVIAVGLACWGLVPGAAFGHDQLVRSAQASGGALLVTLVVAGFIVKAQTGAFVPPATAVRVLLALGGCGALGMVAPHFGRLVTPLIAAAVGAGYVAVLVALREIGKEDLILVKGIVQRRR
jgi:stage V sporulation protein B